MPGIDFWMFVAGLGVFLLGINQMENGLKNLAGKSFRIFFRKYTDNIFLAILVGVFITAILQSSSVVSLMTLAFVGAGIIPLKNAIALIFGTNLGTTVTGWIVASIGFKFPIDTFALPLLGVGGIFVTFFNSKAVVSEIGRFLVGFGALFMGLEYMKSAIDIDSVSMELFSDLTIPVHLFFLVGVVLTAVIQSSSATMAIVLSALYTGIISLEIAGAIVIGGYLGTTITVLLGSLKGGYLKKQVAYAHVGFNFITSVIALIFLIPLISLIENYLPFQDPLYQLVSFHSIFTLIGILLMLPFLSPYTNLIQRFVHKKEITLSPLLQIVPPEITDGATEAIRKEAIDLLERIKNYRFSAFNDQKKTISDQLFNSNKQFLQNQYAQIQLKEGEIISYFLSIQREKMTKEEATLLQNYIRGINRMTLAAKSIKNILHTINALKESSQKELEQLMQNIQNQYTVFYTSLQSPDAEKDVLENIEDSYRKNVNAIYELMQKQIVKKDELTSFLHLNSQIRHYKLNFTDAWNSINLNNAASSPTKNEIS